MNRFLTLLLGAGALFQTFVSPAGAQAPTVIWQQNVNFSDFSDWGPSQRSQSGQPSVNKEIADDFDLVGTISRIDVNGFGVASGNTAFVGVYVRFYGSAPDTSPGALQAEYFVPKGDPRLLALPNSADFRIELGSLFNASGRHFVSVQVLADAAWYWRSANEDAPRGTALYYRDPGASQTNWTHTVGSFGTANCDTAFKLYGTRTLTAPALSALSAPTLAQAGRLKISGNGFGAQQGSGVVRIGGALAPVSSWSDSSITAYVSDASPVGANEVQVITSGGASNTLSLQVTARPAPAGRVQWRFMADDLYIKGRPALGSDGTIYAAGVNGHLYALSPNGGIKWIFHPGPSNVLQPVSVGGDGTIYYSSEPEIYAINPNGTLKWKFTEPAFRRVFVGPTVGPDGNIYAVSEDFDEGGLGEFQLSPSGQLLRNDPGYGTRQGYSGIEVVFGSSNQFYFTSNANSNPGLSAYQVGGGLRWEQTGTGQPRVAPDGSIVTGDGTSAVHPGVAAHRADGTLKWHSLGEGTGIDLQTSVDVGPDGASYLGTLTYGTGRHITSLDGNGAIRWQYPADGIAGPPAVSPLNTQVVVGTTEIGAPTRMHGISTGGQLLWSEMLPSENGGHVRQMSTPRFSANGSSVYIGMDVNDGAADLYTYLYAFSTGEQGTPPTPTPAPTATPGATPTPTPVATPTPAPTATPIATPTPGATATPIATPTPGITPTPLPTATPGTTATPVPTATPGTTATPLPTATPGTTATPMPTTTPGATPTPTSSPAPTATPGAAPAQPLNISTRARVLGGDSAMIGGFILGGSGSKQVLIRAVGPSLGTSGLAGALNDTTLDLYGASGELLARNDDWSESQRAQVEATGLAPGDPRESAILIALSGNASYTAVVRGKDGAPGVGVVEVYDLGPGNNSKLANISTRGFVDRDNAVMIGGFIVGGASADRTRMVVRAIGPSLGQFGITNSLQDPTLSLYDSNGSVLSANDNWQEGDATGLVAAGLAPTNQREAALVQSLPPGAYTAIVAGKSGTVGVGLVEAYHVP